MSNPSSNTSAAEPREGEFFVAYLPTPPRIARFARGAAWLLVAAFIFGGVALAVFQQNPGRGSWSDTLTELEGVIALVPYPMLIDGQGQGILIVEPGKFGSGARLKPFDGQRVTLRGTILQRDRWRMIELSAEATAVVRHESQDAPPTLAWRTPDGKLDVAWDHNAVIHGEIVDPKCFLGAMRPGEGKTHKACASLCIFGGIPPMIIWTDASGGARGALLILQDGAPANDVARPFAGEVTNVYGDTGTIGGWDIVRIFEVNPSPLLLVRDLP